MKNLVLVFGFFLGSFVYAQSSCSCDASGDGCSVECDFDAICYALDGDCTCFCVADETDDSPDPEVALRNNREGSCSIFSPKYITHLTGIEYRIVSI